MSMPPAADVTPTPSILRRLIPQVAVGTKLPFESVSFRPSSRCGRWIRQDVAVAVARRPRCFAEVHFDGCLSVPEQVMREPPRATDPVSGAPSVWWKVIGEARKLDAGSAVRASSSSDRSATPCSVSVRASTDPERRRTCCGSDSSWCTATGSLSARSAFHC